MHFQVKWVWRAPGLIFGLYRSKECEKFCGWYKFRLPVYFWIFVVAKLLGSSGLGHILSWFEDEDDWHSKLITIMVWSLVAAALYWVLWRETTFQTKWNNGINAISDIVSINLTLRMGSIFTLSLSMRTTSQPLWSVEVEKPYFFGGWKTYSNLAASYE